MTAQATGREEEGRREDEVVHGGEDDPLGGGVADLEESDEVSEGIPEQRATPSTEA